MSNLHTLDTPWGVPDSVALIHDGIYSVSANKEVGIMVGMEVIDIAISPAARKYGFEKDGFLCFEGYPDCFVAVRELMDHGLLTAPFTKTAGYAAALRDLLRKHRPEYWSERAARHPQADRGC